MLGNGAAYRVPWVAFFAGARILGAHRAGMFALFEPGLAGFVVWLIFGRNLTPPQRTGLVAVPAALFLFERRARAR